MAQHFKILFYMHCTLLQSRMWVDSAGEYRRAISSEKVLSLPATVRNFLNFSSGGECLSFESRIEPCRMNLSSMPSQKWRLQYLQCIAMRCQSCLSATTWRWSMIGFVHLAVRTVRERIKTARYQSSSVSIDVMLWKGVQSSQKWEKPHHHQLFSVQ